MPTSAIKLPVLRRPNKVGVSVHGALFMFIGVLLGRFVTEIQYLVVFFGGLEALVMKHIYIASDYSTCCRQIQS